MRSDRKEGRRRNKSTAQNSNKIYRIMAIVYSVIVAIFVVLLAWLNILPMKYLIALVAVLAVISVFIVPVMYSAKGVVKRKKIAAIFAGLLIVCFGMGAYYLAGTLSFLGDVAIGNLAQDVGEEYYVIVQADSDFKKLKNIKGETIATVAVQDETYEEAKTTLQEKVDGIEFEGVTDVTTLLVGVGDGTYPVGFVSAASYESMKSEMDTLEETTEVLDSIYVKVAEVSAQKAVDVTKEPFNVYVSGVDNSGNISSASRTDVNMIVTVNPNTHEIMITSIPRDYYVTLASKGAPDKLTHSSIYGIQETVSTVENMLGIDINYYVKVNYNTVKQVVDAIGGIEIDSPVAFTTSGMGKLNGITFVEGYNKLDGDMALAYCRERKSFLTGDMQRNENQQRIIEAVIKKATSSATILFNYGDLLDAVRANMETNMSSKEISSLIKSQLLDMSGWDISKQSIKGSGAMRHCYALGFSASVVLQDPIEVANAQAGILEVMNSTEE